MNLSEILKPPLSTNISYKTNTVLPEHVAAILPLNYNYFISEVHQISAYITTEGFSVDCFEVNFFVNVDTSEGARKWFTEFEEITKTTMPQTKGYQLQEKKVLALYAYEDSLYLNAKNDQELMLLLADHAQNSDYGYVLNLFNQYRNEHLEGKNEITMFQRLTDKVNNYNNSGKGRAIFQEYDSREGKAFILCIVTNLMDRVHKIIQQSVTSDKLELTLKKGMNLLKTLLSQYAFFGHEPNIGPMTFLTDDSASERNTLKYCWPQAEHLLYVFYVLQAFWRIAHSYPGHLQIARRFLCPGWDAINAAEIRQTKLITEYMVPSQEKGIDLFYIVNTEFCTCTCYVGLSGAPCKYQGAVAAKYHIGSLNFLLLLTPNDLARFAYITHGVVANDSFYALLHAQTNYSQHENYNYTKILHDKTHELEGSNTKVNMDIGQTTITEMHNLELFELFLETIKNDYENSGPQLQASLEKLAERYNAVKAKSIPVLISFLHNIKPNNDPLAHVKSGTKICVQVESVKCRKKEVGIKNSKENIDPHIIPAHK
ncbi:24364_t:CDS:2, partial [Gigaspora margarita]